MPSDYGLIAMIMVFTSFANVFVTTGFSSSIVQKKELTEIDKNTIFISGVFTSVFLYVLLFLFSPSIARFYHEDQLTLLIRVQSLSLIISGLYSTHTAILTREMLFKKSFVSSICGVCVQGTIGILLACNGFGVWALVYSNLSNSIVCAVFTWILVKWTPKLAFSFRSFKPMFSFSSKILCITLVNTLFQNLQSLIIGRHYTSSDLAYYQRGFQFPSLLMQQVDGSMNTVMFSSLSKYQDNWEEGLRILRHTMRSSMYICFPLMLGMCAAAEPMILFLLTDKWIESVPYVRIVSLICLFWPLATRSNALNSLGKSGVSLSINICTSILTILLFLLTYKISVFVMISTSLISSSFYFVISAFVYRKYLNYRIRDQISDILPPFLISLVMSAIIYSFVGFNFSPGITLVLQSFSGILTYVFLSYIFKLKSFFYLLSIIKPAIQTRIHNIR